MQLGIRIYLEKLKENKDYCCNEFGVLEIQDFVIPENLLVHEEKIFEQYMDLLGDFKGEITIHGPYMDLNPISMDEEIKEITYKRYLQIIETAKKFNAEWVVIHTYFSQIHNQSPGYQEYWVEENLKFWKNIIPILENKKVKIALENIFDVNPQTIKKLIDTIDSKYFKACVDVGHSNVFSEYSPNEWIEQLGDRVKYLHVSDNHGKIDEHLELGKGSINFEKINNVLEKNNNSVIIISESFCSPEQEKEGMSRYFTNGR